MHDYNHLSATTAQQVMWKPLIEAAAVIRGVGWADMKVGDTVDAAQSNAGGDRTDVEEPSVKKHTITMKFYTQLTEDDDAFDTEV